MTTTDIPLSDNRTLTVRRLGLFELDEAVPKDIPGPYTVDILFQNGEIYSQPFDTSIERVKPDIPFEQCEEKSTDWYNWQEYFRYQEAGLHAQKQYEAYCDYCERVQGYIRQNCLDDIDTTQITPEDWQAIYQAALCPLVSMEDIAAAMRQHF
jgi:hypothetical protein